MKPAIGSLLLVALVTSAGCSGDAAEAEAPAPTVATASEGETLFRGHCAPCHGEAGLGDGPVAAALPIPPANIVEHLGDHPYEEIVRRIVEGIPPSMPPAQMSQDQVRQTLAYVWSRLPDSTQARLRALQITAEEDH